jgi:ABC-type transport system substrate-binding protein
MVLILARSATLILLSILACPVLESSTNEQHKVFVIPLTDIRSVFDPHSGNEMNLNYLASQVYGRLVEFNNGLELAPSLATWEIDIKKKKIIFSIVKNAKFHDGTPIRSSDAIFSLQRSARMGSPIKSILGSSGNCKGERALCASMVRVDETKFEIHFKRHEYKILLYALGSMEGSILSESKGKLVGSGPYKIVHKSNTQIDLIAVDSLPSKGIKAIRFVRLTPDEGLRQFNLGKINYLNDTQFLVSQEPQGAQTVPVYYMGTYYFAFLLTKGVFKSHELRKLVRKRLDRSEIAFSICGTNTPAVDFISKGIIGHIDQSFVPETENSKAEVSSLKKPPIAIKIGIHEKFPEILAELVQRKFNDIGLVATVSRKPFVDLLKDFREGKIDLLLKGDGLQNYNAASMYVSFKSNSNSNKIGYSSSVLDSLIHLATEAKDDKARISSLRKIEDFIEKNALLVPICYPRFRRWFSRDILVPDSMARGLLTWDLPVSKLSWR